jgi:hypothetical protein
MPRSATRQDCASLGNAYRNIELEVLVVFFFGGGGGGGNNSLTHIFVLLPKNEDIILWLEKIEFHGVSKNCCTFDSRLIPRWLLLVVSKQKIEVSHIDCETKLLSPVEVLIDPIEVEFGSMLYLKCIL